MTRALSTSGGRRAAGRTLLAFGLLLLGACARTPPLPAEPEQDFPADFPAARYTDGRIGEGRVFRVVPADSEILIHVHRAGALARLGHNHIVSSAALSGFIFVAKDVAESRFDLYLPVYRLDVDKPALRAAAGEDYATELSAQDVEKTRGNMLGPEVLDAGRFPFIRIRGHARGGTADKPSIEIELTLRDATRTLDVQPEVSLRHDRLIAEGKLSIRQSDFGMTPFSALGGALQVGDELDLSYRIAASAVTGR